MRGRPVAGLQGHFQRGDTGRHRRGKRGLNPGADVRQVQQAVIIGVLYVVAVMDLMVQMFVMVQHLRRGAATHHAHPRTAPAQISGRGNAQRVVDVFVGVKSLKTTPF